MASLKQILLSVLILACLGGVLFLLNLDKETSPEYSVIFRRDLDIKSVQIAGEEIKVDLAVTALEQERGLSGREKLGEGEGMLFIFPKPNKYYFWMKGMKFAIDIIWIDENLKIVYIQKDVRPDSYPHLFGPDNAAKYVLEVNSGFAAKHGVKVGDKVEFEYY